MKIDIKILNWIDRHKMLSLLIVLVGVTSAVLIIREQGKAKCEDCTPYEKIAQDLLNAMLKEKETAFEPVQSSYHYAVYYQDTTKPMTKQQWGKYRDSVISINQKKLDSLKKQKQ